MREHHRVSRRHRVEERRTMLLDDGVNILRRGRAWKQNGGGADRERKVESVAETVREEQLRDAEGAIGAADAEDAPAEEAGDEVGTVVQQEQHALFRPHAETQQRRSESIHLAEHFVVRDDFVAALDGDAASPSVADIAIDEIRRRVERLRDADRLGGGDHGRPAPGASDRRVSAGARSDEISVGNDRAANVRASTTAPRYDASQMRRSVPRSRTSNAYSMRRSVIDDTPTPIDISSPSLAGDRN